jgi:hypothetical protein
MINEITIKSTILSFFSRFFAVPLLSVQLHLLVSVSFNQIFYFTEDRFHKNCLRAYPPAENSSECNRKNDNEIKEVIAPKVRIKSPEDRKAVQR